MWLSSYILQTISAKKKLIGLAATMDVVASLVWQSSLIIDIMFQDNFLFFGSGQAGKGQVHLGLVILQLAAREGMSLNLTQESWGKGLLALATRYMEAGDTGVGERF